MADKRKIAWLIIGGIVILGLIGSGLNKRFTQDNSSESIWSNIKGSDNISEVEIERGGTDKIAIIRIEGVIVDSGAEPSSILSSATGASASQIVRQIDKAQHDSNVKAIILQINSPGGTAVAGQTITERLGEFKNSGKKIYVAMREIATSAAYEISTPADKIYANAETETGSIGVIMELSNYQGLYDKLGLKDVVIKSGAKKDIGSPTRPMTDEEKNILQGMVDESYNNFVATVAKWRKLDEAKVRELGDGRVYSAKQAKDSGLIDEIGNLPAVISDATRVSGAKNPSVVEYSGGALSSLFSGLFQKISQSNAMLSWFTMEPYQANNQLMHIWIPQ